MTRYEQGFMNKCAEYGVDGKMLLEKLAASSNVAKMVGSALTKKQLSRALSVTDDATRSLFAGSPKKGLQALRGLGLLPKLRATSGYTGPIKTPLSRGINSIDSATNLVFNGARGRGDAMEFLRALGLGPEIHYGPFPRTVFRAPKVPATPAPVKRYFA